MKRKLIVTLAMLAAVSLCGCTAAPADGSSASSSSESAAESSAEESSEAESSEESAAESSEEEAPKEPPCAVSTPPAPLSYPGVSSISPRRTP